jgi:hypothetical protein
MGSGNTASFLGALAGASKNASCTADFPEGEEMDYWIYCILYTHSTYSNIAEDFNDSYVAKEPY